MTIKDILDKKAVQYGLTIPVASVREPEDDLMWISAKRMVDELPANYEEVLTEWIDQSISKGLITDEKWESKQKSEKYVKNTSDLKYWGVLSHDTTRTSMMAPFRLNGFELQLVIYSTKTGQVKQAWYALFGDSNMYRRVLFEL